MPSRAGSAMRPLLDNLWKQALLGSLGWVLAIYPASQPAEPIGREFPVVGETSYSSAHHDYPATDILAPCGSRVVSPVSGLVLEVNRVDTWDPGTDRGAARGGRFVSVRGLDGVRYYASHLAGISGLVRPGDTVVSGQTLGRVGNSGSARDTACHLHLGLSPVCEGTGQWWVRRGVVNPYHLLNRWRSGDPASPAAAVSDWKQKHGCPSRP